MRIGSFESKTEAENVTKYIKTKFFRALVGILKVTQDSPNRVYGLVPIQDFTNSSDIDWSKSVGDINNQLYTKYNLTESERHFINDKVQEMK